MSVMGGSAEGGSAASGGTLGGGVPEELLARSSATSEVITPRPITPTFGCAKETHPQKVGSWFRDVWSRRLVGGEVRTSILFFFLTRVVCGWTSPPALSVWTRVLPGREWVILTLCGGMHVV